LERESYVPAIIQSLSLVIDVPIFFFIAGATIALTNRIEVLNVLFRMIFYFGGVVILLDIATSIYCLRFAFSDTINVLKFKVLATPFLPVLGGSYWFVPVFCMVSVMAGLIVKFSRFLVLPIIAFSALIYVGAYFYLFQTSSYFSSLQSQIASFSSIIQTIIPLLMSFGKLSTKVLDSGLSYYLCYLGIY